MTDLRTWLTYNKRCAPALAAKSSNEFSSALPSGDVARDDARAGASPPPTGVRKEWYVNTDGGDGSKYGVDSGHGDGEGRLGEEFDIGEFGRRRYIGGERRLLVEGALEDGVLEPTDERGLGNASNRLGGGGVDDETLADGSRGAQDGKEQGVGETKRLSQPRDGRKEMKQEEPPRVEGAFLEKRRNDYDMDDEKEGPAAAAEGVDGGSETGSDDDGGDDLLIGNVHFGFCQYYQSVVSEGFAERMLALARDNPDYTIFVTGHSLGAAAASVCAADLTQRLGIAGDRVVLYTMGEPRTGDGVFAEGLNDHVVSVKWSAFFFLLFFCFGVRFCCDSWFLAQGHIFTFF